MRNDRLGDIEFLDRGLSSEIDANIITLAPIAVPAPYLENGIVSRKLITYPPILHCELDHGLSFPYILFVILFFRSITRHCISRIFRVSQDIPSEKHIDPGQSRHYRSRLTDPQFSLWTKLHRRFPFTYQETRIESILDGLSETLRIDDPFEIIDVFVFGCVFLC